MGIQVDNVAKIGLTLDTTNIFSQIYNLKEKLDKLSVKNIKVSRGEQAFDGVVKGAKKAQKQVKTLQQALREAENAYSKAYYKNNTNILWAQSDEAKKLVENIKTAQRALNDFNNIRKQIQEEITGKKAGNVQNKDWARQQKEALAEQTKLQKDADKAWNAMKKQQEASSKKEWTNLVREQKESEKQQAKLAKEQAKEQERIRKEQAKAEQILLREQVNQARESAKQEAKMYRDMQKEKTASLKQAEKERQAYQKELERQATRAYNQMVAREKRSANLALKRLKEDDKLSNRSIAQQIRDLKSSMAVNYAKGGKYLEKDDSFFGDGKSQFDRDLVALDNLIIRYNQFKDAMQQGNTSRGRYVDELPSYQNEINFRRNEMQAKMRNVPNYINSDEYRQDIAYIQKLQKEYNQLKADIKGVKEEKQKVNNTKIKTDDIDNYAKRIRQLKNELEHKALNDNTFIGSEDYKKRISEIKELQSTYNKLKSDITGVKTKTTEGFKNYQVEMDKVAREASKVYHELANIKRTDENYIPLQKRLNELKEEYQKLNRESVNFRKTVGISSSRGFYDLNSTYDYFLAKFRSKVTAGIAGIVEGYAMNAIPNFVDTMSNYEQNRANFAQVLPDNIANNQKLMNDAMRDFIQIASDYGASVQEVTEAGRLWGRQYKDVGIIQELVRNSTKLSITDDMSLVEVNKGLEATMQQYNIHLKDMNEAQETSGKIVDTWAKLADNAVVTASDLAKANERSAGAAYNAGISFDYLNAMIATMSSATGKAGGEIGNSIKSMIVSMQTKKAQKFLKEMNIATKELGENGTLKMRSYEKVITEVMQTIKNSPKDYSKAINAFSGGKFQYNNVMALLKNYDNMQKNLQIVTHSKGWADEQVALQYETISRQLKALNAEFQQLVVTLDEAGASAGIGTLIEYARTLIQILSNINPDNIKRLGETATNLAKIAVVLKTISTLVTISSALKGIIPMLRTLPALLSSTAAGITSVGTAMNVISRMTGWLGLAVLVAQGIYTIYEAVSDFNEKANFDKIKKQASELKGSLESVVTEADELGNKGANNINAYIQAMKDAIDVINSSTASQADKEKANQSLSESEESLTELIGAEAVERIKASNFSKEAVEKEIDVYRKMQIVSNAMLQQRIKDEIATTDNTIQNVETRIQAYQKEMEYYSKIAQVKFQTYRSAYDDYEKNYANREDSIAKRAVKRDLDKAEKEWKDIQAKANEYNLMQGENRKVLSSLTDMRSKLARAGRGEKVDLDNADKKIAGSKMGITEDIPDTGKNSKSNRDYSEEYKRDELTAKRNQLWYEGSIQAKKYENALKEITNDEQYYGSTVSSIVAKSNLYGERSKQLDNYKSKLEQFRTELENELSKKMQANPQLISQTQYTVGLKGKELEKNIEVNREVYQQSKTVSKIVNLISAVNQKLEETKTKSIDIANEQRKIADEISKQKVSDIEQQASIDIARINRPTNFDYSKQKNQIELEEYRAILSEKVRVHEQTLSSIRQAQIIHDEQTLADLRKKSQVEIQNIEETKAKVAQLEYEKTSVIRQGLYDVTQQFLIQGNSLRDIWSNLWKDLAREALQRLFRIQAQASILGSLFGWGGGSKTSTTVTAGNYNFGKSFNYSDFKLSHTGENLTGYPKMHTGGMVQRGRLGVVPKLKSDEVIRTLQIGEEVNSVSDRRSNEILATVAMKAIDSRNQQPNNINIMAIDSRSFAEYLNDNADILLAVLNKQGALGRR